MINENHKTVILCGLPFEAAIARRWIKGAKIVCSNSNPERAQELVDASIGQGATEYIGFGIAGGLNLQLPPRTVVVAKHIITRTHREPVECDPGLAKKLLPRMPKAHHGVVFGTAIPVLDPAAKSRAFGEFEADAADMESHCLVRASEAGLKIGVVRVISDGALRRVPQAALTMVDWDRNKTNWANVRRGFRREPKDMVLTTIDVWRARRALRDVAYHLSY